MRLFPPAFALLLAGCAAAPPAPPRAQIAGIPSIVQKTPAWCAPASLARVLGDRYIDNEDEYIPEPGDIIFFHHNRVSKDPNYPNHIGIVTNYDAETDTGSARSFLKYRIPEPDPDMPREVNPDAVYAENEDYYLFFSNESRHSAGLSEEAPEGDDRAVRMVLYFMDLD